jgi:hypothetical protein
MKQNFTVRQGALDGVKAFLSVAQHRSFRRAAAELGVTPSAISPTRIFKTPSRVAAKNLVPRECWVDREYHSEVESGRSGQ